MKQLTDDQARVLLAFLGENWSAFVHCAECNGMGEVGILYPVSEDKE